VLYHILETSHSTIVVDDIILILSIFKHIEERKTPTMKCIQKSVKTEVWCSLYIYHIYCLRNYIGHERGLDSCFFGFLNDVYIGEKWPSFTDL